jgi:hypothetical protein
MPGALQVHEPHDWNETSDVQTRRAGVEPAVGRNGTRGEGLREPFSVLMNEPAPAELIEHLFVM